MHYVYWAWVNLVPPKKKKRLGHICLNATWTYCNTYCCIVSLLLIVPLADNFWHVRNLSRWSLNMFVRHIEYSAFKTISAGRQTRQYHFWIKCDVWMDSRISVTFNWITFDTAEMRRIKPGLRKRPLYIEGQSRSLVKMLSINEGLVAVILMRRLMSAKHILEYNKSKKSYDSGD